MTDLRHELRPRLVLLDDIALRDFLDLLIRPHRERRLTIWGTHGRGIIAALENAFAHPLKILEAPLVGRAVHAAGNEHSVVCGPAYRAYFAVVSAEIAEVLARVGGEDVDGVAVHRGEHVAAVAAMPF